MPLSFPFDVCICPPVRLYHLGDDLAFLTIHRKVDPAQPKAHQELYGQQHKHRYFPRDVVGCVLRQERLGADDIAHAKRSEGHAVDRDFLRVASGVACIPRVKDGEVAAIKRGDVDS